MKIENLQVPNGYSKPKSTSNDKNKDDFSRMLSGVMVDDKPSKTKIEGESKLPHTDDSNVEVIEVEKENIEMINPLLQFLNIPFLEDKVIDISLLGENRLEDISIEAPKSINYIDMGSLLVENMDIVNEEIFNENIFNEDILNGDFKLNLINETMKIPLEKLSQDNTTKLEIDLEPELDIYVDSDIGLKLLANLPKSEMKDKIFSLEAEQISVNEVKVPKVTELVQKDASSLEKVVDDETIEIKKDDTFDVSKWINNKTEVPKDITVTNNTDIQPKELSNQNIQSINDSIIQLMETTTEGKTNVMKVQLYPEELGAVNITLKMEAGKLVAKILVDDNYIKQLFLGKIEQLSNNLIKQNVNMDQIVVELNANANPNGQSQQRGGNFSNQNQTLKFEGESTEQNIKAEEKSDLGVLSILA